MTRAVLITQCLQNDFVQPLAPHDPLPNLLHVGPDEASRLMGEDPRTGPVARTLEWALRQDDASLRVVHVRDWHDPADPEQAEHLRQFGAHCLKDTAGAAFAFPAQPAAGKQVKVVDTTTLNDFNGTDLAAWLRGLGNPELKVGIIGVWTEAKVGFLAYELRTRFPGFELAVCSALTASSSRLSHFTALDQLQKILGVRVVDSVGGFQEWLAGVAEGDAPLPVDAQRPKLVVEGDAKLADADRQLVRYLFRDCTEVKVKPLAGGFSGNLVLATESRDALGHRQVPHVVKLGPRDLIARERTAFERIEGVLGNNAPCITHFADAGGRGGIKYRYASMGGGSSQSFQKIYMGGAPMERVRGILKTVFGEQLGRLYQAAELERCDLLQYYGFRPDMAARVEQTVAALGVADAAQHDIVRFYRDWLPALGGAATDAVFFAYVHGDLNGANIIVDGHENVWLIDFFHTHRGPILKDLVKLENDLLYIFTRIEGEAELKQATALTDLLLAVDDLAKPLPAPPPGALALPQLQRAYETAQVLRSFYPDLVKWDRDPTQLYVAQLRYAVHTLSFDEPNDWQKRWALYAAGRIGKLLRDGLHARGALRVDWLDERHTRGGRLGLTILPGRKDHGRDLASDLASLAQQNVTHVVALIGPEELRRYGVDGLIDRYRAAGLEVLHLPIADQGHCSEAEMTQAVHWIEAALGKGARVLVHCVGGLGRSGTVAACYLAQQGLAADAALAEVRRVRSSRAVESNAQEAFVRGFAGRRRVARTA